MIDIVEVTSPWRSPVPRGVYGEELSLTGDRDGEDGHQSVHIATWRITAMRSSTSKRSFSVRCPKRSRISTV